MFAQVYATLRVVFIYRAIIVDKVFANSQPAACITNSREKAQPLPDDWRLQRLRISPSHAYRGT